MANRNIGNGSGKTGTDSVALTRMRPRSSVAVRIPNLAERAMLNPLSTPRRMAIRPCSQPSSTKSDAGTISKATPSREYSRLKLREVHVFANFQTPLSGYTGDHSEIRARCETVFPGGQKMVLVVGCRQTLLEASTHAPDSRSLKAWYD